MKEVRIVYANGLIPSCKDIYFPEIKTYIIDNNHIFGSEGFKNNEFIRYTVKNGKVWIPVPFYPDVKAFYVENSGKLLSLTPIENRMKIYWIPINYERHNYGY